MDNPIERQYATIHKLGPKSMFMPWRVQVERQKAEEAAIAEASRTQPPDADGEEKAVPEILSKIDLWSPELD
jgi:hypothetical protein